MIEVIIAQQLKARMRWLLLLLRTRNRYDSTWVGRFSEHLGNILSLWIVHSTEGIVSVAPAECVLMLLYQWLDKCVGCFLSRGKDVASGVLLVRDPEDFFLSLLVFALLFMLFKILNENHVSAKLTLTAHLLFLFGHRLVMVVFLAHLILQSLRFLVQGVHNPSRVSLLRVRRRLHRWYLLPK